MLHGLGYRVRRSGGVFLRWCVFAVVIGLVVGAVGAAFHLALEWAGETRAEYGWLLYLLPFAACLSLFGTSERICRSSAERISF